MQDNKVIITAAITGGIGDQSSHPALPVTPEQIAGSAIEAHQAGAAVAHIHVRDPETTEASMDFHLYKEVFERIREKSDMLINLSTGPGARIIPDESDPIRFETGSMWRSPDKRTEHVVKLKPELCSLDVGSMNFGPRIFGNAVPHVKKMAEIIRAAGVKPELEVFDVGHIAIGNHLLEKGFVDRPPIFQLCLGILWGVPATAKNMLLMKEAIPSDAIWAGFAVGPGCFPMVAQSALLGGHVRVGFEDNFFLRKGVPAETNAQLVEKAVHILQSLDKESATSSEAREILNLK